MGTKFIHIINKVLLSILSFIIVLFISSSNVSANELDNALNLYSPVFDLEYYSIHYPEVHQLCQGNTSLMLCYFLEQGMAQGQQANLEFNVISYKNKYPELQKLYGDDLSKYYIDYIIMGKANGKTSQLLTTNAENVLGEIESENVTERVSVNAPVTLEYSKQISQSSQLISQVLELTNKIRIRNGLVPLTTTPALQNTAALRAVEGASKFSHSRPNGTSCFSAFKECGVDYSSAAENIAYGKISSKQVLDAWMKSENHKNNILNPTYTHVGIGVYINKSTNEICWSQEFTN